MDWNSRIRAAVDSRVTPDDDVIEELAQHAAAVHNAARADGQSADEATRTVDAQIQVWVSEAALLRRATPKAAAVLPPPIGTSRWVGVAQDVRYAFRLLRRRPAHALITIITMALGIGATTALFSITWGVLMKPLPWPDADRLVVLKETRGGNPPRFGSFTNAAYLAWREKATTIERIAAWSQQLVTLTGAGDPERIRITSATPSLFALLGAHPLAGSLFTDDEDTANVVVLSESLWRQRFAADPGAVGRSVRLDNEAYTIVGVLPDATAFPDRQSRAWVPFHVPPTAGNMLAMFSAIALLRPGATPSQAAAEGTGRGRFAADSGMTTTAIFGNRGPIAITAQPLRDALTAEVRQPLIVLLAAVGLLLLTATANVTSLQLARATARRRELAIRAAIGAGTARLTRQLLVESALLGLTGGAAGLALGWMLQRAIAAFLPADFPRADDIGVTVAVIVFAVVASVLTGIVFGVLPGVLVGRLNVVESLAEDRVARVWAGRRSRTTHARTAIICGQVAIACVLLVGAALLGRSFLALLHADRGYDPSNLLTARLSLAGYTPDRRYLLADEILNRLSAMPGIADAAFTSELPLTPGGSTAAFTLRSPTAEGGVVSVQASPRIISPRGLHALGLRTVAGRGFSETDTDSSEPVAVVNRAFARRYFAGGALGAKLPMALGYGMENIQATVIGVVDDVRYPSSGEPSRPEIYYSFRQMKAKLVVPGITLLLRTVGDPRALAAGLRTAVREADPNLAPDGVTTMADRVLTSLARPRLYAVVLGGFAFFAIAIAAVGLFGVLSYSVAQRAREIGVRAALGARPADIIRLVVGEGLTITVLGIVLGLACAVVATRWMAAFLYGVTQHDWGTFVAVPAVLIAVATLACLIPARRAARIDPLRVLKEG